MWPSVEVDSTPAIIGSGAVGTTLACVAPGATVFQWFKDGVLVPGATAATYTVDSSDAGHELTCNAGRPASIDTPPPVDSGHTLELPQRIMTASPTMQRPAASYCGGRLWIGTFGQASTGPMQADIIETNDTHQTALLANLGTRDDHSSPVIIAVSGKVPIGMWVQHNLGFSILQYRGSQPAENGFQALTRVPGGSPNFGAVATTITYIQTVEIGDTIHLWTRISAGGVGAGESRYGGYARSSDWGLTWDVSPRRVFDMGFSNAYDYSAYALAPDGATVRRAGMDDSAQLSRNQVRYFEMNTMTGDLVAAPSGSTVVGNVYSGAGLPINVPANGGLVRQAPTGWHASVRDVGRNAKPEVVWIEWDKGSPASYANVQATAAVWYAVYTGGAWKASKVCNCGGQFGQDLPGDYFGSAVFTNLAEGQLLLCRRSNAGEWSVERWHTNDQGDTWTQDAVLARDSLNALARPRQIDGAGTYKALWCRISQYGVGNSPPTAAGQDKTGYSNWTGSIVASSL